MRRYLRVLKELIQLRFHRLMIFRIGFFGPFFVDGSMFVLQLIVFRAIYGNVDRIGTWGKSEMVIFIGTFSLINALTMVIYFFGMNDLPSKIRYGDLDLYLTKPIHPLFRMSFEQINPGSIPLVIMSLVIIQYGIHESHIVVSAGNVIRYLYGVVLMTILWYEMMLLIRTLSFFVGSTTNITRLEEEGLDLCMKIPGTAFRGIFKVIFYCILPYGIMATIPTQSLVGQDSVKLIVFGTVVTVVFGVLSGGLWRYGCKHYNSVSS